MPVAPSSLTDPAIGQLLSAGRALDGDRARLLPALAGVPDPRARRGVRHRLAALDHGHSVVLGQVDVQAKTNEIPMFAPLLDHIDLAGAVVTADALHAQRVHAEYLAGQRGAHYLITVKGNQPSLRAQLAGLPWRQVPVAHDTCEKGHGRAERRTLKITAVAAGLAFPHAAQAIQIARRRRRAPPGTPAGPAAANDHELLVPRPGNVGPV